MSTRKVPQVIPFETFNPSKGKWINWLKRLEMTFDLFHVTDEENRKKMLLCHMGMEAFEVLVEAVAPATPEKMSYAELVSCLTRNYRQKSPEDLQYCWRFWQRHQLPTENVQNFMEALRELIKYCDFECESCESGCRILRNQFVCGLRDGNIRESLFQETNLTAEKALQLAKKMEMDVKKKSLEISPPAKLPTIKEVSEKITRNCYQCTHTNVKNPANWHLVFLKGLTVTHWGQMMKALKDHGTTGLNLVGIQQMNKENWLSFSAHLKILDRLEVIIIGQCMPYIIHSVVMNCVKTVKVFIVETLQNGVLDWKGVTRLSCLKELKIISEFNQINHEIQDLKPLAVLKNLEHLVLTGFTNLGKVNAESLGGLTRLISLELGDCCDLPESFYFNTLTKLKFLKRLRIFHVEKNTTAVLIALQNLPALKELELVNFTMEAWFSKAIALLKSLENLLLVPVYPYNDPVEINDILTGVTGLADTLKVFTLVILDEVVKFTDKLARRNSGMSLNVQGYIRGRSIALLKPNWIFEDEDKTIVVPAAILPLKEIEKIFKFFLPKTSVKLVNMPFKDTWKIPVSSTYKSKIKSEIYK
ncbi:hypothetical protein DMENIID0001_058580 [Sergentomyia squamirostris]